MEHEFFVEKKYKKSGLRDFSRVTFEYLSSMYAITHFFESDLWCIAKEGCPLFTILIKLPNDYLELMYELLRMFDYRKVREILEYLS